MCLLGTLATSVVARDIPDNVQALYDSIRGQGSCKKKLASGFYAKAGGSNSTSYRHGQYPAMDSVSYGFAALALPTSLTVDIQRTNFRLLVLR